MTSVHDLLREIADCGLALRTGAGDLLLSPKSALAPDLTERLIRHKPEIVAVLGADTDPFTAVVARVFDGMVEPADGLPNVARRNELGPRPSCHCGACRRGVWWRLRDRGDGRPGGWTCAQCHPAAVPPAEIDVHEAGSSAVHHE